MLLRNIWGECNMTRLVSYHRFQIIGKWRLMKTISCTKIIGSNQVSDFMSNF